MKLCQFSLPIDLRFSDLKLDLGVAVVAKCRWLAMARALGGPQGFR